MNIKKILLTRDEFKNKNRRSFLFAGAAALAGLCGLGWLINAAPDGETPYPLRKGFKANESFWKNFYSSQHQNSATAAPAAGTPARVNGDLGLDDEMNLTDWKLEYESPSVKKSFTLKDLENLPRFSSQAEFRCIEGWSIPIGYEGIKFSDFLQAIDPQGLTMPYVGLETPDAEYYVGVDMESMLHPQTFLADKMNGLPLGKEHGEPLRLIIPVKYGIKNLKRIGKIFLAEERPRDYWAENGYDWYSGL